MILVEGFFDVFNLWRNGFRNIVALMGTSISKDQEKLIVEYLGKNARLTLLFDSDEASKKMNKEVIEKLIERIHIKTIKLKNELI